MPLWRRMMAMLCRAQQGPPLGGAVQTAALGGSVASAGNHVVLDAVLHFSPSRLSAAQLALPACRLCRCWYCTIILLQLRAKREADCLPSSPYLAHTIPRGTQALRHRFFAPEF